MTAPHRRRLATSHWAVLLAGPIVGTVCFFVVYLLAEASCADELELLDTASPAHRDHRGGGRCRSPRCWVRLAGRPSVAARTPTGPVDSELAAERRENRRFMVFVGPAAARRCSCCFVHLPGGTGARRVAVLTRRPGPRHRHADRPDRRCGPRGTRTRSSGSACSRVPPSITRPGTERLRTVPRSAGRTARSSLECSPSSWPWCHRSTPWAPRSSSAHMVQHLLLTPSRRRCSWLAAPLRRSCCAPRRVAPWRRAGRRWRTPPAAGSATECWPARGGQRAGRRRRCGAGTCPLRTRRRSSDHLAPRPRARSRCWPRRCCRGRRHPRRPAAAAPTAVDWPCSCCSACRRTAASSGCC